MQKFISRQRHDSIPPSLLLFIQDLSSLYLIYQSQLQLVIFWLVCIHSRVGMCVCGLACIQQEGHQECVGRAGYIVTRPCINLFNYIGVSV